MNLVNIGEAKAKLSQLIELALSGKEIIIGKRNKPLVELKPLKKTGLKKRQGGQWKGKIWMADDFDILPEEITEAFKGVDS